MAIVWVPVLAVLAVIAGWAHATYLRGASPTDRIPLLTWRLAPRGRPLWALWLGGGAAGVIAFVAVGIARDHLALAVAVVAGCTTITLLMQTALIRRHNERVLQHH